MLRMLKAFIVLSGGLLILPQVFGSDFEIRLQVDSGGKQAQTERTEEYPSLKKPQPRPVVQIPRDQDVKVSWLAQNAGRTETFSDVLVHFFVVAEKKVGQATVPALTADVAYEGAMTMDFKPGEKADWHFTLRLREPGNYLLRVETKDMKQQHGHDHFAAMDLVVR